MQEKNFGVQTLFQMELSEGMLLRDLEETQNLAKSAGVKLVPIIGDEEFLPFPPESLDLVTSNLNIHWVNDLPALFSQVRKALKPDGLFLGSIFGEGTLPELRYF